MEKNSLYTIGITIFVLVIIISLYSFYSKIRKLQSTQTQIQKHLMYQQGIIEKHNSVLQSLNGNEVPIPSSPSLQQFSNIEEEEEPVVKPRQRQVSNPMDSLLPMLSSVMGMMTQGGLGGNSRYENEEDESEEEEEEEEDENVEERKMEMVREIEKELKELGTKVENPEREGRLDEEEVSVEKVSVEE